METMLYQIKPRELETQSPFKDLFPLDKIRVEILAESMRNEGFLKVYPIAVWNGVVVDGHTRLAAAKKAGIREVECAYMQFKNEDDALAFAIRAQRNRRNLTEADILRCIETLDKRQGHGGDRKSEIKTPEGALIEPAQVVRSSRKTAELLGISPRQVERARTIIDHAPEELKESVAKGEKTISGAYNEVQADRKPKPEPIPVPAPSAAPAPAFDFEFGIMKTVRASSVESAREQFLIWCRTASEKQIMAVAVCEKAKVSA